MVQRVGVSTKDVISLERLRKFHGGSKEEQPDNYKQRVVLKPWGYEFLIFENEEVAIWHLHIKHGHSTSMHCHPQKKTSLIILSGHALCNTFEHRHYLQGIDAVILDKAVFHSTKALSLEGINILEVEMPPNKTDLVRLNDQYGRELIGYEGSTHMRVSNLEDFNYFYFEEMQEGERGIQDFPECSLSIEAFCGRHKLWDTIQANALYCVCRGQLIDGRGSVILEVGDTAKGKALTDACSDIQTAQETLLLKVI